jgi:predicted dehydrogenase
MLERERPDIVSICTRAADRIGPTLDAIASGPRAMLLEKHLSASLAEGDAIVGAGDRARIPVIVNLTFRYAAGVAALAERVRGGAIGALRTVVCYPGALLVHSGVHFFDLCRLFGTGEARRVFGRLDGDPSGDPPGSGYIEFDSGARAYVDARSRATHGYMEFHGAEGVARVGNDAECSVHLWRVPAAAGDVDRFYQPVLQPASWRAPADEDGSIRDGRNINRRCIDDVVACLDTGRAPAASAHDCLLAQEMAVAMHVSHAEGGRLVDLPLPDRGLRLNAI